MAYKNIDVARCSMEELKKEIQNIRENTNDANTPQDAMALHYFTIEAGKRIRDEIAALEELKKFLTADVLGVSL